MYEESKKFNDYLDGDLRAIYALRVVKYYIMPLPDCVFRDERTKLIKEIFPVTEYEETDLRLIGRVVEDVLGNNEDDVILTEKKFLKMADRYSHRPEYLRDEAITLLKLYYPWCLRVKSLDSYRLRSGIAPGEMFDGNHSRIEREEYFKEIFFRVD